MKYSDFFYLIDIDLFAYILILIGSCILYFILFKKWINSLFDPFLYLIVASCFGFSVVAFLKYEAYISDYYFYQYMLSQIAFLVGLISVKPIHRVKNSNIKNRYVTIKPVIIKLIRGCFWVYFISMVITYYKFGIPLFMDSRLELYQNSNGLGILGRFSDVYQVFISVLIIISFVYLKINKFIKTELVFMFLFVTITVFISGSKGAILFPFQTIFIVGYMFDEKLYIKLNRYIFILLPILLIFPLIVISVQSNNDDKVLLSLVYRFISYGDIYFMSYVDKCIESIRGDCVDLVLSPLLQTFRLYNSNMPSLGNQIYDMLNPINTMNVGPNARINVLSYVCFGYVGSIFFSFIIGRLVGYLRNRFNFICINNIFLSLVFSYIYLKVLPMETDLSFVFSNLSSLIISSYPVFIYLKIKRII